MLDVSWCVFDKNGVENKGAEGGGWPSWPREISEEANQACRTLASNLLATTGERIWGLTFTLFPDGKFKIEYDYNKPEGYEETDETISMDDAVKGLSDFN